LLADALNFLSVQDDDVIQAWLIQRLDEPHHCKSCAVDSHFLNQGYCISGMVDGKMRSGND
jgi:hypothetical protein